MRTPALILGAGPTGLSAAYHLGGSSVLVERDTSVGGHCRSVEADGFTFDPGGHTLFASDPYLRRLYRLLLGDNVQWHEREAWVHADGAHGPDASPGAPDGITQSLLGAIETRPLDGPRPLKARRANQAQAATNGHAAANGHATASGHATPRSGHDVTREPRNFEEYLRCTWGADIARRFAVPYHRKLWTVPPSELETSWLDRPQPLPDTAGDAQAGSSPAPSSIESRTRFGYPRYGGFQALMDGFLPRLGGHVRLAAEVLRVSPRRRLVTFADGSTIGYETIVSTLPLPELVRCLADEAPDAIREAAASLRRVSARCVNLGIGRAHLTGRHWIYYPGDTVFHKVFVPGNASPACNPPGGTGLTCEITYSERSPLACSGDDLIRRCLADCRKVGILRADDPVRTATEMDIPYAYVVPDHGRAERVATIRRWLRERDIVLAGRRGAWEHDRSDHAFLAGRRAANTVREILGTPSLPACAGVPAARAGVAS